MSKSKGPVILTYDGQRTSYLTVSKSEKSLFPQKSSSTPLENSELKSQGYITQADVACNVASTKNVMPTDMRLLMRHSQDTLVKDVKDDNDHSNHPSYSKLKAPYYHVCRKRYKDVTKQYEHQLQTEIKNNIVQQANAFDAVCFVRVLSITSLWPPLHTHGQIDQAHNFFKLSSEQKKRLAYIMRVDWSKT